MVCLEVSKDKSNKTKKKLLEIFDYSGTSPLGGWGEVSSPPSNFVVAMRSSILR